MSARDWKTGAKAGFAPAPSVGWTRGIVVRGAIVESAAVVPLVLRRYRTADGSELLPEYLLGLALGGLVTAGRRYHLRSGCELVPAGAPECRAVYASGERRSIEVDAAVVVRELREVAREWSRFA